MTNKTYDIIIVGGGVMGCATAYYLLKFDSKLKVAILEMDSTYEKASTPLSDGNMRIQFNIKENIQMSQYGLQVMKTFADDMAVGGERQDSAFRQQGNLFILDEASKEEAHQGYLLQKSLGCEVQWLSSEDIKKHYPIYNLKDCVAGTLGTQDGTMSPMAVLTAYRKKAIELGAVYIEAQVTEVLQNKKQMIGVKLNSGEILNSNIVLNAAGAWASVIAKTIDIDLPVVPIKRDVAVLETSYHAGGILPALFLPTGLYVIHEGENIFTCGKSFADDYVGYDDFKWDKKRFEELVWSELVEYIPSFDRIKVTRGWAGLYEVNTLDDNAILGEYPLMKGFYLANGFSGHGFQQAHAVGRYTAELMLNKTPTLDLSIFSAQRILDNKPVFESHRKII